MERNKQLIRRRNFDITFHEIRRMYNEKDLIIQPEFQRLFRWSIEQQSLFIESLLLDMPVPPIYLDENADGSYVLIDGLQRVSTYLNFLGAKINTISYATEADLSLREDSDEVEEELDLSISRGQESSFTLRNCEILTELNGKKYSDLDISTQRELKRSFIRAEVLTKETDNEIKYHMFKRLNSGGALLSSQELRNSNIRLIGSDFINFINDVAQIEDFKTLTENLPAAQKMSMKREELVLRYFYYKKLVNSEIAESNSTTKLDVIFTEFMEQITSNKIVFDYENEKKDFIKLVEYLNSNFGSKIFGYVTNGTYVGKFITYNYDAFMLYFSDEQKQQSNIGIDIIYKIQSADKYKKFRTGGNFNLRSRISMIGEIIEENISL